MSLFSTAYKVQPQWLCFFHAASLLWLFEGVEGKFKQNDSEISESKPRHVCAGFFSSPKMLGGETGSTSSRAGPGACVAGGCPGLSATGLAQMPWSHHRVVVLLQEDQGVGLGRGEPCGGTGTGPGLPFLGAVGAANLPF